MIAPLYRVFIVRYGTRAARRSGLYLNYELYGEPDGPMDIDYFFWVVTGPAGTVLVDCGFSRAGGEARGRVTLIDPADALGLLGIAPAQVGTLVVTHAHYDHIGNLELFSNARIVIAASELKFWGSPTAQHRLFDYYAELSAMEALARAEREGRLDAFSDRAEPLPGVVVTEVGGHTPGQAVVEFATSEGPVLLASDCVHFYEELERAMPFSVVTDLPGMYAGYEFVRARLERTGAHLVTGHDVTTRQRFRPHPGPIGDFVSVIGDAPE